MSWYSTPELLTIHAFLNTMKLCPNQCLKMAFSEDLEHMETIGKYCQSHEI